MSDFKTKNSKTKDIPSMKTMDLLHKEKVKNFYNDRCNLNKLHSILDKKKKELGKLNEICFNDYTTDHVIEKSKIKKEIANLNMRIDNIEGGYDELEYFGKTNNMVMNYYELTNKDNIDLYKEHPELIAKINLDDNDNISQLDEIHKRTKLNVKPKKPTRKRKVNRKYYNKNILESLGCPEKNKDFANNANNVECFCLPDGGGSNYDTEQIYDKYLTFYGGDAIKKKKIQYLGYKYCSTCNIENFYDRLENLYVCKKCGETQYVIMDCEKPNCKDSSNETTSGYPYKRINHFNELLYQFQAKESTKISKKVYDSIKLELSKRKIHNYRNIGFFHVRVILKKLKLTRYYEHVSHIVSQLTKKPPPAISREIEEKLKIMFKKIQKPFEKYKPYTRINFLSYSYVFHKFFQLLELDNLLSFFPMLKSRDKLAQQDIIWKKICKKLKWKYYKSL